MTGKSQIPNAKPQRIPQAQGKAAAGSATGVGVFVGIGVLFFLVFVCGCRSAKPKPEPPMAVTRADRSLAQAKGLSEQQNWAAAAAEWRNAARDASLLNDGAREAVALHNLADTERQLRQYDSAISNALAAAEINDTLKRADEWWRNQVLLLQLEDLDTNRSPAARLDQLRPGVEGLKDAVIRGAFWNELGLWQHREGQLDDAAASFIRAQAEYESVTDRAGVATVMANRAKLLETQGQGDLAARAWADALRRFEALGEPVAIAHALLGQGRALMAAHKDLPKADIYLRRAGRNFRHLQLEEEAAQADELLDRLHAGQ
jgi:tetratricopeptide (TPR) repeat protein